MYGLVFWRGKIYLELLQDVIVPVLTNAFENINNNDQTYTEVSIIFQQDGRPR